MSNKYDHCKVNPLKLNLLWVHGGRDGEELQSCKAEDPTMDNSVQAIILWVQGKQPNPSTNSVAVLLNISSCLFQWLDTNHHWHIPVLWL